MREATLAPPPFAVVEQPVSTDAPADIDMYEASIAPQSQQVTNETGYRSAKRSGSVNEKPEIIARLLQYSPISCQNSSRKTNIKKARLELHVSVDEAKSEVGLGLLIANHLD
ncbi:MAG: hypothetical protein SGCHY_005507 [Lobulomycetales sp.]